MNEYGNVENTEYIKNDKIPSKYGWVIFLVFGWNPNQQLKDPARRSVMQHLQHLRQRHNNKKKRKKIKNEPPLKHKNAWSISVTHNCTYTYVWNSVSSWQSCNPWLIKINNKNLTLPYKYKRIALKMGVRGLMSLCESQRENHVH